MVDLSKNFGYQKTVHTVPAKSLYTVDFEGNKPNYFRLANMGNVTLYCSTMSLPSDTLYEFKADGKSVANFTEPHTRDKLYIYNPTSEPVRIMLTTWAADFDPSFMAISELTINPDVTMKTDGVVKGFTSPLPSGDNKIGKVDVEGIDSVISELTSNNGGALKNLIKSQLNELRELKSKMDAVFTMMYDEETDYSLSQYIGFQIMNRQADVDNATYIYKKLRDSNLVVFQNINILEDQISNQRNLSTYYSGRHPSIIKSITILAEEGTTLSDVDKTGYTLSVWYDQNGDGSVMKCLSKKKCNLGTTDVDLYLPHQCFSPSGRNVYVKLEKPEGSTGVYIESTIMLKDFYDDEEV